MGGSEISGFEWVATLWGLEPRWTIELDEDAIQKTVQLALQRQCPASIMLLAKGTFNRVYSVGAKNPEAAVIRIRFEWILMEKLKGKTLSDAWREIDFTAKQRLVRQIAQFYSDTFSHQMETIGSLYESSSSESQATHIGKSTSFGFYVRDPQIQVHRGPFTSSRDWITALIDAAEVDCKYRLEIAKEQSDDEEGEDSEDLETSLIILAKLRGQIVSFFPGTSPEPTILMHDDLNKKNIIVDAAGSLSGVVDWEGVSACPLSIACQYPGFLDGKDSTTKPVKSSYMHDEDGKVNELYWEHLEFWELHQLRILFMDIMQALQPRWVEVFNKSQRQRDFYIAIWTYDNPLNRKRLLKWLSDLESGIPSVTGLEERIHNSIL
ncbi:unnamed protein product [Clonostachys rhizophaga]|uniref:Aminoglycoside phosphotransferase domain-containing protein n=1 Tax=Clonostachys rhizophaga TaxID=160324 RepID=A0A9N9VWZ6_9HYPO|nr:unnamed protein product [Clonostachys rhizophaga]